MFSGGVQPAVEHVDPPVRRVPAGQQERLDVRVAPQEPGGVAAAVHADVERLVRPDGPARKVGRAALAQVVFGPPEQFGPDARPPAVGPDGDGGEDALRRVEGGQVVGRPEPGVGEPDHAAVVLGDDEAERVEVGLVEDGVFEGGVGPQLDRPAVGEGLVPEGDHGGRVGVPEGAVAHVASASGHRRTGEVRRAGTTGVGDGLVYPRPTAPGQPPARRSRAGALAVHVATSCQLVGEEAGCSRIAIRSPSSAWPRPPCWRSPAC